MFCLLVLFVLVLRLKDLRPVHWMEATAAAIHAAATVAKQQGDADDDDDEPLPTPSSSSSASSSSSVNGGGGDSSSYLRTRFMCPCCRRTLTNAVKSFHLRKCGHVLCSGAR